MYFNTIKLIYVVSQVMIMTPRGLRDVLQSIAGVIIGGGNVL